jgi:hypothetical protein
MKSNLPQRFSCVCHRTFCIDVVSSVAELKIVFVFCLHRHRLKKSDAATLSSEYISLRPHITAPVSGGGDFTGLFGGGRFGVLALSEFRGSKFWQIWLASGRLFGGVGYSGCVAIGFGHRKFWREAVSTLAEAACFCVCYWRIGVFAAANFGGFGGRATLATGGFSDGAVYVLG